MIAAISAKAADGAPGLRAPRLAPGVGHQRGHQPQPPGQAGQAALGRDLQRVVVHVRRERVGRLRASGSRDTRRGSCPAPGRRPACRESCRRPPATCSSDRRCSRRERQAIHHGRRAERSGPPPAPAVSSHSVRGARRIATTARPDQRADPGVAGARDDRATRRDSGAATARPAACRSTGRARRRARAPSRSRRAASAATNRRSPSTANSSDGLQRP